MKQVLLFFIVFTNFSYSQEKRTYYFNKVSVSTIKDYERNESYKTVIFSNTKDSTYTLSSIQYAIDKKVSLLDKKKRQLVTFKAEGKFESENDLENLKEASLFKEINYSYSEPIKISKKEVEFYRFERDSIVGNVILHYIRYKNDKLKKIVFESFYFFEKDEGTIDESKLIHFFKKNFDLPFKENEKLVKQIYVKNNKIIREVVYVKRKKIDVNFEFNIEYIYPKKTIIFR